MGQGTLQAVLIRIVDNTSINECLILLLCLLRIRIGHNFSDSFLNISSAVSIAQDL